MIYTSEVVKGFSKEKLVNEFAQAHMNSVSRTDPNLPLLRDELLWRLTPCYKKIFKIFRDLFN
ncbi:MAG: hypothetical protein WCG20_00945 [bacterium]